uniref:Uncharacterized protein n=1 Tax=Rhizophora mucronata TaxID=61149 RepID=A0A2P2ITZ0_RHIMU
MGEFELAQEDPTFNACKTANSNMTSR